MLSDSESESGGADLHEITINEHYAKAFEYKKEREELAKLEEKYGPDYDEDEDSETDSEEDESEDEDGEELTPTVDAAILRTLARIKRKDPAIYNSEQNIFGEEQERLASAKVSRVKKPKDKSKPITMRQVALESALHHDSRSPSPEPLPHVEEQRALRDETIAAFHHALDGDKDEDDGLLVPREKTKDEREREEEEYRAFLEREVGEELKDLVTVDESGLVLDNPEGEDGDIEVKDGENKMKKKKKEKAVQDTKPKGEADQEFLMNYILNRGWIDRSANHIPTYGEITSSKSKPKSKGKGKAKEEDEDEQSDADSESNQLPTADPDVDEDDFEEIVDRFESSYNFRFEEPDAAVIQAYPRNLPSLVRREDTTRKDARERKKQRKEEELLKKREEVKRLKGLKMKEIRTKLEAIGREGGKDLETDAALQELDLEGDWDPDAHDKQMAGLYGNDDDLDEEKPQWDDNIDLGGIMVSDDDGASSKKSKKKKKKKKGADDDGGMDEGVDLDAMDADVVRDDDEEEWDGTEEMRKRKLEEYMDEIYGLDFNDLVGGLPTRFKYTSVAPQNFALTPAEILMSTDQELNEYMSVKKYAPYRKQAGWDHTRNERLRELKEKVSERLPRSGFTVGASSAGGAERPAKKRMGKKERMKMKGDADAVQDAGEGKEKEKGDKDKKRLSFSELKQVGNDNLKRKRGGEGEDGGGVEGSKDQEVTGKKKRRRHKKKEAGA